MPNRRRGQASSGSTGTVRATSAYAARQCQARTKQNLARSMDVFWDGIDEAEFRAISPRKMRVKQVAPQTARTTTWELDKEVACPCRPVIQVIPEPEEQKRKTLFQRLFKAPEMKV